MRGSHDLGGLKAGPVDTSPHDPTFWEKQIDGHEHAARSEGPPPYG